MGALRDMGWKGFSDAIWVNARRNCIPISGTFELTPLCNFRCRMCYVRLDAGDLPKHGRLHSTDEWLNLARQAMEAGTYRITLTGGEVLTRPDFEEIYRKLIEMGLIVSVLSNGSLITSDTVRLFTECKPSKLRFTLYGASNETYNRLCGVADGFDQTMRSLRMLKDAGVPFSLAFTETTENVDDLDAVLDIAEQLHVGIAVSSNIIPAVRGSHNESKTLRVPLNEQPSIARPVDNHLQQPPIDYCEAPLNQGGTQALFSRCRAFRTSFFIQWNGMMETCAYLSTCNANAMEMGFDHAWKSMHEQLSRFRLPDECIVCKALTYCTACPGSRESETGKPDGVPLSHCREICSAYDTNIIATVQKEVVEK